MNKTVYIESDSKRIRIREKNLVIESDSEEDKLSIPLMAIKSIVIRGRTTLTSPSIVELIKQGIVITFLDYYGNYSCSIHPDIAGNVEVRHNQLRLSDNKAESLKLSIKIISGKVLNQISVLDRYNRNYGHDESIDNIISKLQGYVDIIRVSQSIDTLRGYEGIASKEYFSAFNKLIRNKSFNFYGRQYHPCKDNVNAMLSFEYGLLRHEVEKQIQIAGLDVFVGFMHTERSGKPSLALDLMEEYRPYLADRLVIGLINNRVVTEREFEITEDHGVICNRQCRESIIEAWEKRKRKTINYYGDKITFEALIQNQIRLLVKHIKGIDTYRPFIWR